MPTNLRTAAWALCLLSQSPGVIAAPTTTLPPAPLPNTVVKGNEPVETPDDASPPTAFTRVEAGRALNLGQLESIQAETVLYEAQLARAKALNELQKNGYDRGLDQPFNPAPPALDGKAEVKSAAQDVIPPQIVEITGTGNGYLAVLSLSNGNQVTVQAGNRIPGTDFIVKRVTLNEVVVSGNNQSLMSLSFAG